MVYLLGIVFSMLLWLVNPAYVGAAGTTYYVATNGNGSACSASAPCSLSTGVSRLAPGDTLVLKAGTYTQPLGPESGGTGAIPSGTATNRVTITVERGATVTLPRVTITDNPTTYVTIDGSPGRFIVDANLQWSAAVQIAGTGHLRLQQMEIRNGQLHGISGHDNTNCEFINLNVHDNGMVMCDGRFGYSHGECHGIYADGDSNLIDGGEYWRNDGYGLHLRPTPTNWTVRNTKLHDNTSGGIITTAGPNTIYNSLVYNNGYDGIFMGYNDRLYNNTVYGNPRYGIYVRADQPGAIIRNNIAYGNGENLHLESGPAIVQDHNLTANPNFVNAASGDFRLLSGSVAIDAGAIISQVPTSFDGVTRPQGKAFDIGAYEYTGLLRSPLSAPSNLRTVGR